MGGIAVAASVHDWSSAPVQPVMRHVSTYSSGLSFRSLPGPSYAEIEKMCDYYLTKGQGIQSGRASRLLFELANGVKGLVSPLRIQDDQLRARVLYLESLMKQWSEVFGFASDPTEVLRHPLARSPIELREKLNQLGDENEDLKCKLESAKLKASLTEQACRTAMAERESAHRSEMDQLRRAHVAELEEMLSMLRASASLSREQQSTSAHGAAPTKPFSRMPRS